MFNAFVLFCLCRLHLIGVLGSSSIEMQSFSVTEGDSVTLHSGVAEIHTGELTWHFVADNSLIALINRAYQAFSTMDGPKGRFRNRLKLDNQTGSLTITNIRSEHAGDYEVQIFSDKTSSKRFRVTVYARLPVPVLIFNSSQCFSSQNNCSVLCSVVNVSAVSLSWYKGNSLLSSISVSDLSISLSLPLEVEYQDKNTYSCVISNTISKQTTQLDINTLCQPCSGSAFWTVFITTAVVGSLLTVAAVWIIRIYNNQRKTDHEGTVGRRQNLCWNVGLFLLPGPTFSKLPTVAERKKLTQSGFGSLVDDTGKEKQAKIQINWSLADLKQFICQSFPDVSLNLVGYELAKADRGKKIKKLQVASVRDLKQALGRSRLYILPLAELKQESAPLSPNEPEPEVNFEATPSQFSGNIETANRTALLQEWRSLRQEEDNEFEQSLMADREKPHAASLHQATTSLPLYDSHSPSPPNWSPAPSPAHWSSAPSPSQTDHRVDLQMILKKLHSRVDLLSCPTSNQINVYRDNILQGCLQAFKRRRFNPEARLDVIFVDSDGVREGAVDERGPTREFLRLLMREIQKSKIFEGPEDKRLLALDTHALDNGLYMAIAKMIAVCIIHGGVGPHFFSDRLFMQISGQCTLPVSLEEIADSSFREKLSKIKDADSVDKANTAISDAGDSLYMKGALRYISSLEERDSLVQSAAEYFVNGRTNLALRQFEEGFKTLGLIDELRNHPEIFEDVFINAVRPLEAKDLSTLFEVDFSPLGSNKRQLENKTVCFWRDWLIDVEEGDCNPLTLEMVLEFASGASSVPPFGFPHQPKIEFLHTFGQEIRIFPEANTCLIVLRLPIHNTYESFRTNMTEGILQSPTFGTM